MYFPYVRGRQYELLALKELVISRRLSRNIVPILEPVKLSSTLSKTMESFVKDNRKLCVICNPTVGSFNSDMRDEEKDSNQKRFLELLLSDKIIKSHIMKKNSSTNLSAWEKKHNIKKSDWYVINTNRDFLPVYTELFDQNSPKMVFIPDESAFRRTIKRKRSLLEDRFNKCERNSDYSKNVDEFFSDDHLCYEDDGFDGFSDYSVIGEAYLESGFAPYAVAIHIVYFDKDNALRIHHFVSDSNYDIQNPAGKFYEAVTKLANWVAQNNIIPTSSLQIFLDHHKNQTYPGLGSVKKLSLMHHLELIGMYLDEVN
ncbi:sce7725 family protein [Dehalobacter restrictus]|uniref:sce7725 family protein n=1 Tax=Dehalobacter restrictus TaxID=55583 RepID=UPI00301424DB